MLYIRLTLAAALCALLVLSTAVPSYAKSTNKDKNKAEAAFDELQRKRAKAADIGSVKHTGKSFRNKRIKVKMEPNVEIVEGKISGINRDGIYMDGEYFKIAYGKIVSSTGNELKMSNLFFGLKARVKFSYDTIEKTTISGMVRRPRMTKEDWEKARELKRKEGLERMKDIPDRSLPPGALEYKIEPPADVPRGRK